MPGKFFSTKRFFDRRSSHPDALLTVPAPVPNSPGSGSLRSLSQYKIRMPPRTRTESEKSSVSFSSENERWGAKFKLSRVYTDIVDIFLSEIHTCFD